MSMALPGWSTLRSIAVGTRAALQAPRRIAHDLDALLEMRGKGGAPARDVTLPLRVARFGVRALAAIPGTPWRNTCLFRTVAECLVLREYGVAARVRLGVRGAEPDRRIDAHAWIEWRGSDEPEPADGFTPIAPLPRVRAADRPEPAHRAPRDTAEP